MASGLIHAWLFQVNPADFVWLQNVLTYQDDYSRR